MREPGEAADEERTPIEPEPVEARLEPIEPEPEPVAPEHVHEDVEAFEDVPGGSPPLDGPEAAAPERRTFLDRLLGR